MNSDGYKKLCNQPNAFSRCDIEITKRILREKSLAIALHLSETLQTPITKPVMHKGDEFTDYFFITLSKLDVEIIIDVFTDLEAENVEGDGTTTSLARFYAGVADKWINYLASINP